MVVCLVVIVAVSHQQFSSFLALMPLQRLKAKKDMEVSDAEAAMMDVDRIGEVGDTYLCAWHERKRREMESPLLYC